MDTYFNDALRVCRESDIGVGDSGLKDMSSEVSREARCTLDVSPSRLLDRFRSLAI